MLLPFVRFVIGILLLLTSMAAFFGVARIHMIILSFLSGGLLLSLQFFESEFNKARGISSSRDDEVKFTPSKGTQEKSD